MSQSSNLKGGAPTPYDFHVGNEKLSREYQVSLESMRIVKERLSECVLTEKVNQFVNCKELREQYFALCNDRYKGMLFPENAQPVSRVVPGLIRPDVTSKF